MNNKKPTKKLRGLIELLVEENKDLAESFQDEDLKQDAYVKMIEILSKHSNLPHSQVREKIEKELLSVKEQKNLESDIQREKEAFCAWKLNCINANEEMKYKVALPNLIEDFIKNSNLPEREKVVIIERYGLMDQLMTSRKEIAERYFVETARVLAIESRAIRKLRYEHGLTDFIEYMDEPTKIKQKMKKYNI